MAPDSYLDRQVNQGLRSVKKSPGEVGNERCQSFHPPTHHLSISSPVRLPASMGCLGPRG